MRSGSFKNVFNKMCLEMDLALNNLQWLICHKTKSNKIKYYYD